ncbi:hypothetical protein CBR_g49729 [Chara braunii]|uniref:Uncharacterized protein n=1 Tax=Chara braunii TaxID=69332 RepID=A0A388M5P9_CHABU|nr:hypothetical protein CBR_g49729 [Chara braunii]|eukprot:GBG89881.1 hypothetical protein CBR_g49729 [Chara braunii]
MTLAVNSKTPKRDRDGLTGGLDAYLMEEEVLTDDGLNIPPKRARGKRTAKNFGAVEECEEEARVMSRADYEKSLRRKACTPTKTTFVGKETPTSRNIVQSVLETRAKLMAKEWREIKKLCEARNITYGEGKEETDQDFLGRAIGKKTSVNIRKRITVRVRYGSSVKKRGIRDVLISNIESCDLHPAIAGIFRQKARVVWRRNNNVVEILCNYKQLSKKPELPCACKHYGLPVVSGHVLTRVSDVPGLPALVYNGKNVVHPRLETTKEEVSSSIRLALTTVLGNHFSGHLPDLQISDCFSSEGNERVSMDEGMVYVVKKQYKDLLITQVDRNADDLVMTCTSTYQYSLDKMFTWNTAYDEVSSGEAETLKEMKRDFEGLGLHKLVNWNSKGKIGSAYVLPKHKDLERWRPIAPACSEPTTTGSRWIARTLNYLLEKLPGA